MGLKAGLNGSRNVFFFLKLYINHWPLEKFFFRQSLQNPKLEQSILES